MIDSPFSGLFSYTFAILQCSVCRLKSKPNFEILQSMTFDVLVPPGREVGWIMNTACSRSQLWPGVRLKYQTFPREVIFHLRLHGASFCQKQVAEAAMRRERKEEEKRRGNCEVTEHQRQNSRDQQNEDHLVVVVSGGKEKEEAANPTQTAPSADSVEQFDKINPPETTDINLVKDKPANGNSQVDIVCTEAASAKEKSENSEKVTHKSKMENKDMSVGQSLAPGLASILKNFLQKKVNNKK